MKKFIFILTIILSTVLLGNEYYPSNTQVAKNYRELAETVDKNSSIDYEKIKNVEQANNVKYMGNMYNYLCITTNGGIERGVFLIDANGNVYNFLGRTPDEIYHYVKARTYQIGESNALKGRSFGIYSDYVRQINMVDLLILYK